MSRDWAPELCYEMNKHLKKNGKGDVMEVVLSMTDEKTGKLIFEDAAKHGKEFPLLMGLFPSMGELYKRYPEKDVNTVFRNVETQIKSLADEGHPTIDKEVGLWFKGELIPGYYLDENNEAFYKFVENQISSLIEREEKKC